MLQAQYKINTHIQIGQMPQVTSFYFDVYQQENILEISTPQLYKCPESNFQLGKLLEVYNASLAYQIVRNTLEIISEITIWSLLHQHQIPRNKLPLDEENFYSTKWDQKAQMSIEANNKKRNSLNWINQEKLT